MKIQHFAALVVLSLAIIPGARAATNTWTGADPSGNWSAPANWSPAGVPTNGNDLVFPGGLPPGDMVSTNDLTDSFFRSITFGGASRHTIRGNPITLTNRSNCILNGGTNVIACDLTFSGTPSTPTFGVVSIRGQLGQSGLVSELTLIGNVGGGSLYGNLERLVINGQFTGGTLRLWGGTLTLNGDDLSAGSAEIQNSATLLVQGSRPNLNITTFWEFESAACPHLRGNGVVGDILGCGHVILDSTLSVKNLGGRGASQYGWRVLDIRLNGTNAGEYGRLISSGDVTLTGGSLSASPGFNPQPGQVFTIVDKISPGPITTVPGYDTALFGPEGKIITLNGMPFRLSYVGGDGNDVTLTVESNFPPAVTISNPLAGAMFTAPASFSLTASASDSDGSVSQVRFFVDSTAVGTDTVSPYSANVSNLALGTYTLSAVATDNQGASATNSITVIVNARPSVLAGPITNAANGHIYYLLSSHAWTASEAEAVRLGGHLVTINDPAENQWVLDTFFPLTGVPYASLWIGLNDAANEGQFVWANGEPVTFTYWYPGEPNNAGPGGEDYATIRHPSESPPIGSWNDLLDAFPLQNPAYPIFGVVEMQAPTSLPLVATQPAEPFIPGSARLNGRANPSGSPTLVWFEWGASLAYGNATAPQAIGSGYNDVGFSNVLAGLVSGTEYHFRALASNAFGVTAGLDQVAQSTNAVPIVTWQQPANNAAFPPGFTLSLRSHAMDSDGTVSNVEFFATPPNGPAINVGQGTLASDGYYVRGWTNPPPGQYQLHAEAMDNAGGRGISDSVQIVVVDTNQGPVNAQTRTWTGADPSGYWSAPANWSPAGVLVNGDTLVFPGGLPPADMVSTNDLTDRLFRSITFSGASRHTLRGNPITLTNPEFAIINDGTNVIACDLTFTGTPVPPTPPAIWNSSFDSGELTVIGNVESGSLYIGAGFWRLVIMGQFTGSFEMNWYATLALYGDNPYAVSAVVVGSTLLVQGSQPNLNITMYWNQEAQLPAILSGNGLVGDVTGGSSSTRITLDSTLSVRNLNGALSTLFIRLNGTNVGEYGRLVASGNVSLSSARLLPSAGFDPQPGQVFTIVEKTSPGPVTGAFFGLSEGTITNLNGMPFRISYVGGDGNDVTLTVETNARPTVTITNPPNATVFTAPASFSLEASASDPDGSVTNVQFFRNATSLGNDSSSPYSVSVSGLAAGNYTLSAVASDNHGLRATNSIVVTVGGQPPATNTWTGADPSGNWSAPANWSPVGVPVNGNDLVFPGGLPPGDMVSTNDLPDSLFRSITFSGASRHTIHGNPITLTNRTDCIINRGTNVIACDLTFSGTPSTPTWGAWSIRPSDFGELTVIGNVGGSSLYVAYMPLVIRGQFTGGSLFAEYGDLALYGDNPHDVSVQIHGSSGSILRVEGSQPNLNIAMLWEMESASCPTLTGDGVVGDVTGCGYITPDSTLLVNNLLGPGASPASWRTLWIRLNGTNVGEYGRLVAPGEVRLSGGFLQPFAGFNPQAGQVFTIVEKTSPGVIANEFLGPEGSVTTLNGKPLRLSYLGGDGNDVTLTVESTNTVNAQPTVSIISPTNGAILAAPFGGTIQANAADSDGTVVRVDFFSDAALVGSVSNAPFHLAVTNIAAGTHALFAVATDDRGATRRSATVTVTNVTPIPIVLSAVQHSGSRFAFSYSANLGLRYAVERSATLSNWTPIWSNTANFNPMTFTDTTATNRMDLGLFAETFNSSNGGFTVTTPQPYAGSWNYNSGAGTWQEYGHGLPDNGHPNTSFLDSPPLTITAAGQAVLSFNHRWSREQDSKNWDGNQLRVSVNGGAFVAVAGTSFTSNGYNGIVNGTVGTALDGQHGWVGTSPGYTSGFLTSVAVLGNFNSGDVIRLRFMAASDSNTTGPFTNGWEIDSVQVNQGEPFTVGASGVNDFYRVRRLPNP